MSTEPILASIGYFAGTFVPRGWFPCDGRLFPIQQYTALFALIGTKYGGDGRSNFAVPDLRKKDANGHGIPFDFGADIIPCICIEGVFPSRAD